jgi:toluene monooxygenase system protein E
MIRQVPPLKTYSHLAGKRQVPSEYEIVSTGLLYHPTRGFETDVPVRRWYQRYQRDARLRSDDWERFEDPRATTYPLYTSLQAQQEAHLDGVLRSWLASEHDLARAAAWHETFLRTLAPLRFALHGFQMIAAYVGQMAPSGRLTMAALFQSADQLRRVHRLALHLGVLRKAHPFGEDPGRAAWQSAPAWQPLRRVVEQALVAFDWGEALVALNLCLAPLVERLFFTELAPILREERDYLVAETLSSFDQDGRWHQAWSTALVKLAVADHEENAGVIQEWIDLWYPRAREAVSAAAPLLGELGPAALERAVTRARTGLQILGMKAP